MLGHEMFPLAPRCWHLPFAKLGDKRFASAPSPGWHFRTLRASTASSENEVLVGDGAGLRAPVVSFEPECLAGTPCLIDP